MEVRKERTGWRDSGLSARHRQWGWDCPAVDIDFLLLEYDLGIPVALIEYKQEGVSFVLPKTHPSFRALQTLANNAGIFFFVVVYASDFSSFRVIPSNERAEHILTEIKTLSESAYKDFLYRVRERGQVPLLRQSPPGQKRLPKLDEIEESRIV